MNKARSKAIAKAYIKNKFNGTKTGLEIFNTTNKDSAKAMMHKTLKSPQVQNDIQAELAAAGLTKEYLNKVMYEAIEHNKQGKPSQAVLAQLLIQSHKIYNYLPKDTKEVIKQERKVFLDKEMRIVKEELTASTTRSQELLQDIE